MLHAHAHVAVSHPLCSGNISGTIYSALDDQNKTNVKAINTVLLLYEKWLIGRNLIMIRENFTRQF